MGVNDSGALWSFQLICSRTTTPAKPCEGRFGYIWFVCLPNQGYIVDELAADHTDNEGGEALFVNVYQIENSAYDRMETLYHFFFQNKKCQKIFMLS